MDAHDKYPRHHVVAKATKPAHFQPYKQRRWGEQCNRCHSVHMTAQDAEYCKQANSQREQL